MSCGSPPTDDGPSVPATHLKHTAEGIHQGRYDASTVRTTCRGEGPCRCSAPRCCQASGATSLKGSWVQRLCPRASPRGARQAKTCMCCGHLLSESTEHQEKDWTQRQMLDVQVAQELLLVDPLHGSLSTSPSSQGRWPSFAASCRHVLHLVMRSRADVLCISAHVLGHGCLQLT